MRMRKVVIGGLVFGLLVGCGGEQEAGKREQNAVAPKQVEAQAESQVKTNAPKTKPQSPAEINVSKKIALTKVKTGPFEPPKPWDFLKDGRPKNTFTLTHMGDKQVCTAIADELNKPLEVRENFREVVKRSGGLGEYRKGWPGVVFGELRYQYFNSKLSVSWTPIGINLPGIIGTGSSYAEADVNHDGVQDYILRGENYWRYTGTIQDKIKYVSIPYEPSENLTYRQSNDLYQKKLRESGFDQTFMERLTKGNIDIGSATPLQQEYNGMMLDRGQYVDVIEVNGRGFLLLGGLSENELTRGALLPPVRVLQRGPKIKFSELDNPHYTYTLICELRQNYFDQDSTVNTE